MQFWYVSIPHDAKKLLLELSAIYRANKCNQAATQDDFNRRYMVDGLHYSDETDRLLDILHKAGYIEDISTLKLSPQGADYHYCFWAYWRHRVLVPWAVSFATSIITTLVTTWIIRNFF